MNWLTLGAYPPFMLLLIGAVAVACTRGRLQKAVMLAVPIISFGNFYFLPENYHLVYQLYDLNLQVVNSDKLARLFGILFHLATLIGVIFALKIKDTIQHTSALVYAACAIGAIYAGDWITLFLFWEGMALSSVFLIWARRNESSYRSGIRYLIMQVLSGVLLLSGALLLLKGGMPAAITDLSLQDEFNRYTTIGTWLIFLTFGIKAGFPLVHTWITDSYAQATATGSVFLTAFTSKVAIFMFIKVFSGESILIPIGLTMACFPIFLLIFENDLRKVLTYSIINQIGFMLCGIGIGTEIAINGVAATAFNHVIYKGLLMMSMGAVLYRVGHVQSSDLGGLYRSMPFTTSFCVIGAAAMSAVPFFNGFVSKAVVLGELLHEKQTVAWAILLSASVGIFYHVAIKVPFFAFFHRPSNKQIQEAPKSMLVAMGLSAVLCLYIGINPQWLYQMLPYTMEYSPYDATHILTQFQLLFFAGLVFIILYRKGWHSNPKKTTALDIDWFYRKGFPWLYQSISRNMIFAYDSITTLFSSFAAKKLEYIKKASGPFGILSRGWGANNMIFIVILLLGLLLFYDL